MAIGVVALVYLGKARPVRVQSISLSFATNARRSLTSPGTRDSFASRLPRGTTRAVIIERSRVIPEIYGP